MGKHPDYVEGFNGSMSDLAKAVSNMSYDKQAEFVIYYSNFTRMQSKEDMENNKPNLAKILYNASKFLTCAISYFGKAWEICEPRTEKIKRKD